jgi:hypothetical protein
MVAPADLEPPQAAQPVVEPVVEPEPEPEVPDLSRQKSAGGDSQARTQTEA